MFIDGKRQGVVKFRGTGETPKFKNHKVFRKLGKGKHTVRLVVMNGQAYIASFITIR